MKKLCTLVALWMVALTGVNAQYLEVGTFFGVSNYQGDLTYYVLEPTQYNLAMGAFARYNVTQKWAVKAHLYGGSLTGSDQLSRQRDRNLKFETLIYEGGLQLEYNLANLAILDKNHISSPYLFAGVSMFHFNPKAEIDGSLYALQPLGTEGQGLEGYDDPYNLMQVAIPFGAGVKFAINQVSNIGFEAGFRKTFTDHIDDVSGAYPNMGDLYEARGELATRLSYRTPEYDATAPLTPERNFRGNAKNKDWYFFGGVTLSVNLGGDKYFGKYRNQNRPSGKMFYSKNPFYGF